MKKLLITLLISMQLWAMEEGACPMDTEKPSMSDQELAQMLQAQMYQEDPQAEQRSREQSWVEWGQQHMPQPMNAPQCSLRPSTNSSNSSTLEQVTHKLEITKLEEKTDPNQISQTEAQKILFQLANGKTDFPGQTLNVMVTMLITAGANVYKVDQTGKTVIQCAEQSKNQALLELLRKAGKEQIEATLEKVQKK